MKTPLFFKLLLILALGFRLIKAAKKPKPVVSAPVSFALGPFVPGNLVPPADRPALEQVVWMYRQHVRQIPWESMTSTEQAIKLLYTWSKQRESAFRLLWYQPEYALAFGDLLKRLAWNEAAESWNLVLQEISGQPNPTEVADWIPQGNTSYPTLETFQALIRSESIYSKFITYVFSV